jgi:hypothetical protein
MRPHLLFDVELDFEEEHRAGTKLGLDPGIAYRAAGIFVLTKRKAPRREATGLVTFPLRIARRAISASSSSHLLPAWLLEGRSR